MNKNNIQKELEANGYELLPSIVYDGTLNYIKYFNDLEIRVKIYLHGKVDMLVIKDGIKSEYNITNMTLNDVENNYLF